MTARILDGVGVAALMAFCLVSVAAVQPEPPKPTVPLYEYCSDPAIPWYLKLDCFWL